MRCWWPGCCAWNFSNRAINIATLVYVGFFGLDYLYLSRGFLEATVHLVFFLAVVKILTARTTRDYAYTAVIAFLELLAAAVLSASLNFFGFLSLYLLFAMATFTSRRSAARCRNRRRWRAAGCGDSTCGSRR